MRAVRPPKQGQWVAVGRWLAMAAVALLMMLLHRVALAEEVTLRASAGVPLRVTIDMPPGDGQFPAVVLAPGQGYHKGLPAMEATARALVAQGIAVFRFDWGYFSAVPRGQPSADLGSELQDLQAVIAAARAHPRILAEQVIVGGKSLGSIVAWRALASDPQLRGALLLTPVCSRVPAGESVARSLAKENYPGLAGERRPTLWISGDRDPLCSTQVLYAFIQASERARIGIVGGDHGFEHRDRQAKSAAAMLDRNLAAVGALCASFVAEHVGPSR